MAYKLACNHTVVNYNVFRCSRFRRDTYSRGVALSIFHHFHKGCQSSISASPRKTLRHILHKFGKMYCVWVFFLILIRVNTFFTHAHLFVVLVCNTSCIVQALYRTEFQNVLTVSATKLVLAVASVATIGTVVLWNADSSVQTWIRRATGDSYLAMWTCWITNTAVTTVCDSDKR